MFRFTIRDVLWLMALLAMGVAWYFSVRAERAEKVEIVRKWEGMTYKFRQQIRAELGLPPEARMKDEPSLYPPATLSDP